MIITKGSKGKPFDLIQLSNQEELAPDIINSDKTAIVQQGVNFFYFKPSFFSTILAPIPSESIQKMVSKRFDDCVYKPNEVVLFKNNYKEFELPHAEFRYIMRYFQAIYDEHKTEAGVLLLVHPELKQWRVFIPVQVDCSGGGVNYLIPKISSEGLTGRTKELYDAAFADDDLGPKMESLYQEYSKLQDDGWCLFGTIHSHCNFGAFHSGVDDRDEIKFEGLHITIGNVRSGWTYAARFMFDSVEFKMTIEDILNVESMSEIEKDVSDIEVFEEDMSLIRPEVGTRRKIVWQNTGNIVAQGRTWGSTLFDQNEDSDKNNWLQESSFGNPNNTNYEDDDELEDEMVIEENMVRLFRFSDGKVIWVSEEFFTDNLNKFSQNDYVKLDNGDIPDDLIAEAKLRLDQLKEDESSYENVEDNDLYIYNNHVINPDYPRGHSLELGEPIEDIQEYRKRNRKKATKKGA